MWDPIGFYDDLDHSVFKICLHVGQILVYDFFQGLWSHKTAWNRECPTTVPTVKTKKNVTKFARK
jgi:hypothetical protein